MAHQRQGADLAQVHSLSRLAYRARDEEAVQVRRFGESDLWLYLSKNAEMEPERMKFTPSTA